MEALAAVERRGAQRVPLHVEVDFCDHHNFYTGFVQDISVGGLFVATHSLREIGTEVDLSFELPDGSVVEVLGRVRWLRDPRDEDPDAPPGMGIEFLDLAADDEAAIWEFIEHRPTLFYED